MSASSYYDDHEFSYADYWQSRNYEHHSEELAIKRLLGKTKFSKTADVGGGYGRLSVLLAKYSKEVILVEPSEKMRKMAKNFLLKKNNITVQAGNTEKTGLGNETLGLYSSFRVFHHIPDLAKTFIEIKRVLKPNGYLLLEFANSANFKARLRSFISGRPLMLTPVEMRSDTNIKNRTIAFVNHHPDAVIKLINRSGFKVEKILSVSNFRSGLLKKLLPLKILLILEYFAQSFLSSFYFGPSIFVLARRV